MNQYKITYKLDNGMTTSELRYASDEDAAKTEFLDDMESIEQPIDESAIENVVATGVYK